MRALARLLCIVTPVWTVNANVEKTIFLGPHPVSFPNASPSLHHLRLDTLDTHDRAILATQLSVQFPSESAPRGLESWYLLRRLESGRRYEVRICWPATQPTDFWLDTYPLTHVFDTPALVSSLARYSEQQQEREPKDQKLFKASEAPRSLLFLRVQAAASYYSTNRTLMEYPPAVDVDIILDPFLLNIFPRSLGPVAAYISVIAVGAWFLSAYVYKWLLSVAKEPPEKPHTD